MQVPPQSSGVLPEHSHWRLLGLQDLPVEQVAIQVPPQSSGVVPEQTHWAPWQTLPPVHCVLLVH
jgi:hypothetical protein